MNPQTVQYMFETVHKYQMDTSLSGKKVDK